MEGTGVHSVRGVGTSEEQLPGLSYGVEAVLSQTLGASDFGGPMSIEDVVPNVSQTGRHLSTSAEVSVTFNETDVAKG